MSVIESVLGNVISLVDEAPAGLSRRCCVCGQADVGPVVTLGASGLVLCQKLCSPRVIEALGALAGQDAAALKERAQEDKATIARLTDEFRVAELDAQDIANAKEIKRNVEALIASMSRMVGG